MRLFIFSCAIFFLLLAGCHLMETDITKMDPKKLPDVTAFQDDFTREFMGSVDEVEEGFYLFQSKTGRYTMMYPENASMHRPFYGFTGEDYEKIRYAGNDEEVTGAMYTVDLVYKNSKDTIRFSTHLAVVSRGLRYDGDFEKIETEDTEIYFATNTFPVDGERV